MIFVLSLAGAAFLGVGWVVQQRVAVRSQSDRVMGMAVLLGLIRSPLWWAGIASMAIGQSLSAWALQLGAVSTVEPVLTTCLLFALVTSAVWSHQKLRWQELVGPVLLCVALAVFLAAADPQTNRRADPGSRPIAMTAISIGVFVAVLCIAGFACRSRTHPAVASGLFGAGAGVLYGLQDAATRGAVVATERHDLQYLVFTLWPWVLLAAATAGTLFSQGSFRAGRLDYALPPTAVAQAVAGIGIGVGLLDDELSGGGGALALELGCLAALVLGVALVARAGPLRVHRRRGFRRQGQ